MFDLGKFFKEVLPTAVVLLPLTGAAVKYLGNWVSGKAQLAASMVVGLALGGPAAYFITAPSTPAGWFAVVLYGLAVGLATSGFYEMQKASSQKAVKVHMEETEERLVMGGTFADMNYGEAGEEPEVKLPPRKF